jgi:NAD(P)-dependent dehydrogenase (short-subunit alcohol dehydrogenase family)
VASQAGRGAARPMEGRTVLITGGTDGIGLHTACGLAAMGARMLVTGRDPAHGAAAEQKIRQQAGHDLVSFLKVDHSTVGANQDLAARLGRELDRLDVLVNNVGRVFPARQETADGYEATLALCFVGPAALTAGLLPLLRRGTTARVLNMNSSAFRMWRSGPFTDVQAAGHYVGLKAYAHAKLLNLIWTFALADQLREAGTTVNATNPGAAWTPGTAQLTPEAVPAWRYIWPIVRFFQRRASAEKAAAIPIWLCSAPEAALLTGMFVQGSKRERPQVAVSPANQEQVRRLAAELVATAPTALRPT